MPYVDFDKLSIAQQAEAIAARPKWQSGSFPQFAFWVRANGHVSRRGGHHQLTKDAGEKLEQFIREAPRSKGDLRDWKPGVTFHFDHLSHKGQP